MLRKFSQNLQSYETEYLLGPEMYNVCAIDETRSTGFHCNVLEITLQICFMKLFFACCITLFLSKVIVPVLPPFLTSPMAVTPLLYVIYYHVYE
jgi:hypothetical protein